MIYSWDVSTSFVGMCAFDEEGNFKSTAHCDLRKVDGLTEKANAFKRWLDATAVNVEPQNTHFIEERLGNFSGGRTMLQVLMKLAAFNAVVSYILANHRSGPGVTIDVDHIHPSTWKASMKKRGLLIPKGSDQKKQLTLEFVRKLEPSFDQRVVANITKKGNPPAWAIDEADAYCIGLAGWMKQKEQS